MTYQCLASWLKSDVNSLDIRNVLLGNKNVSIQFLESIIKIENMILSCFSSQPWYIGIRHWFCLLSEISKDIWFLVTLKQNSCTEIHCWMSSKLALQQQRNMVYLPLPIYITRCTLSFKAEKEQINTRNKSSWIWIIKFVQLNFHAVLFACNKYKLHIVYLKWNAP